MPEWNDYLARTLWFLPMPVQAASNLGAWKLLLRHRKSAIRREHLEQLPRIGILEINWDPPLNAPMHLAILEPKLRPSVLRVVTGHGHQSCASLLTVGQLGAQFK
jgi:hypothetical protein